MKRKSEGVHRLSILTGGLASFAWFLFILIDTHAFTRIKYGEEWLLILVGLIFCFFIPFTITRAIYWVVIGFNQDKRDGGAKSQNEESNN